MTLGRFNDFEYLDEKQALRLRRLYDEIKLGICFDESGACGLDSGALSLWIRLWEKRGDETGY